MLVRLLLVEMDLQGLKTKARAALFILLRVSGVPWAPLDWEHILPGLCPAGTGKRQPSKQLQLSFELFLEHCHQQHLWDTTPSQNTLLLLLHMWIYMRLESEGGFHVPELKFSVVHRAAAICCTTAASTLSSSWYHSILLGTTTSIMHWRLWFTVNVIKNTLISMLDMFNIESTFNKTLSGFHSTDTGNFDWLCSTVIS